LPELIDRESLRDLDGIRVEVDPLPSLLTRQGLSAEGLAADVEAQLRRAGVHVLMMGEFRTGDPHIQLVITTSYVQSNMVASRVEVNFVQICFLRRNPLVTFNRARTWNASAVVTLGPAGQAAARIRRDLTRQIEQFIEDYKAVNS